MLELQGKYNTAQVFTDNADCRHQQILTALPAAFQYSDKSSDFGV